MDILETTKSEHVKNEVNFSTWEIGYSEFDTYSKMVTRVAEKAIRAALDQHGVDAYFPCCSLINEEDKHHAIRHPLELYIELPFGSTEKNNPTYKINLFAILASDVYVGEVYGIEKIREALLECINYIDERQGTINHGNHT